MKNTSFIVLLTLSNPFHPADAADVRSPRTPWKEILRLADTNRTLLLLHKNLRGQGSLLGPAWAQLERQARLRLAVWDAIAKEIGEIQSQLEKTGIRWILIKTIRQFPREIRDVDVLIFDDDLAVFTQALARLGYFQSGKTSGFKTELKTYRSLPDFRKVAITIDAHSRISYEGLHFVDEEQVWKRRSTTQLNGSTVSIPSLEHQLLTLVLNSFFGDAGLRLCDVFEFVQLSQSHSIIKTLRDTAREYGWQLALDEFVKACTPYKRFLDQMEGNPRPYGAAPDLEGLPAQFKKNVLFKGLTQKAVHDLGRGGGTLLPSWGRVGMKLASRLSRDHLRKDSWNQIFAR